MSQELTDLISRAKEGDREAFSLLVQHYTGAVYRHAYGMLGDRMEAEDVAQEAFIKAYTSIRRLEHLHAFSAWLTRIVSNLCYDRLHSRKQEKSTDDWSNQPEAGVQTVERIHLRISIEEAMSTLTPEHREVILLRDVHGYSYDEMAEMLGIPLGTVKSRMNAARMLLRSVINSDRE